MTNKKNGTLYIGVTSNLIARIWQHKEGFVDSFTKRYNLKQLVWYEIREDIENAIHKEKTMKGWPREWKLHVINKMNPEWRDLYDEII